MHNSASNAEEILGQNFFGVEDWISRCKAKFTAEQFKMISDFPWDENTLNGPCPFTPDKKIKETHFGFWGPSALDPQYGTLNIYGFYDLLYPRDGVFPDIEGLAHDIFGIASWQHRYPFVHATCKSRWYLVTIDPVPKSLRKSYEEQLALLPPEYEVPLVVEEFGKSVLYYLKNGFPLKFQTSKSVRCRDLHIWGTKIDLRDPTIEIHMDQATGVLRAQFTTSPILTVPTHSRPYIEWGQRNTPSPLVGISASRKLPFT